MRAQTSNTGHPTAQTPTVDREVEFQRNIPGRGYVDHGVNVDPDTTFNPEDVAYDPQKDYVHYDEPVKEPVPIPVYMVAGPGQGAVTHMWHTLYAVAGGAYQPRQIIGQHDNRTKLRIRNTGAEVVYIGDQPSVSDMFGWPIEAGEIVELSTSRAVYAVVASTSATATVSMAIIEEFDVVH